MVNENLIINYILMDKVNKIIAAFTERKQVDIIVKSEGSNKVITISDTIDKECYHSFVNQYYQCGTNDELIIDITTVGGETTWAYMIAKSLQQHEGPVTARITKYALSAGTIIALACSKITLSNIGCLGPIDPQCSGISIIDFNKELHKYTKSSCFTNPFKRLMKYVNVMLNKVEHDHRSFIYDLLKKNYTDNTAKTIYDYFTFGRHHSTPIFYRDLCTLGLNLEILPKQEQKQVSTDLTQSVLSEDHQFKQMLYHVLMDARENDV